MISRIDHVSIAVKDFEKANRFFKDVLGTVSGASGTDDSIKYFWNVFSVGDLTRLELITPTGEGSFLDNFLKDKKDGGVHHLTVETPDIDAAKKHLADLNVPYFGFNKIGDLWKELFIHPRDAFGILIQIAEFAPNDYLDTSMKFDENRSWSLEKSEEGCRMSLAHPGGGKVDLELTKEEIKKLIADLEKMC